VYLTLGDLLRELGEFENSLELYQSALEVFPDNVILLQLCATASTALGKHEEPLSILSKALEQHPESADSLLGALGRVYRRLGDVRKATECFEEAIKKGNKAAYGSLGFLQLEQGDVEAAEPNFLKVVALIPSNPFVRLNLGIMYEAAGDQNKANTRFSEAISIVTSSLRPSRAILRVAAFLGLQKFDEASTLYALLRDKIPKFDRITRDFWQDLVIMSRNSKMADIVQKFRNSCTEKTVSAG
jgi:tetratricopeptide (TPR) repeat protein